MAQRLGLPFLSAWLLLLLLTALVGDDPPAWGKAFGIGIGTRDPFEAAFDAASVPLGFIGWLAVPITVGAAVSLLGEGVVRRSRPYLTTELQEGSGPAALVSRSASVSSLPEAPDLPARADDIVSWLPGDVVSAAQALGYGGHLDAISKRYGSAAPVEDWLELLHWYFIHCGDFYPEALPSTRNRRAIVAALDILVASPDVAGVVRKLRHRRRRG